MDLSVYIYMVYCNIRNICGLFTQATSENAVVVLQQAIGQLGTPAAILSDNGSCFVDMRIGI